MKKTFIPIALTWILSVFEVRLPNVLNHPLVEKLFQKMKDQKLLKEGVTFDEWKKAPLANYEKSDQKDAWRIRFDVKSSIVWKDLNFYPGDAIEHTIEIPFPYFENRSGDWLLTVRVINGILKLQFGPFSYHISPVILEKEPTKKYQEYFTITSFPLIYFAASGGLPAKYLAQSYSIVDGDNEFKEMIGDFHAYNYLVDTNAKFPRYEDSIHKENSKWSKTVRNFGEKGQAWLKKENFGSLYDEEYLKRAEEVVKSSRSVQEDLHPVLRGELLKLIFKKLFVMDQKIAAVEFYEPFQSMYEGAKKDGKEVKTCQITEKRSQSCLLRPSAAQWTKVGMTWVPMIMNVYCIT